MNLATLALKKLRSKVEQTLKEQRERSDARVRALSRRMREKEDNGWSDEDAEKRDKTHSPNSRSKLSLKMRKTANGDEELKDRRSKGSDVATKKVETEPKGLVVLPSEDTAPTRFGSPHMSPDILDRCSKMELKLAKCNVPRKSNPLFSGSQFYSPPERSAVNDQPRGRGDDGGMESERSKPSLAVNDRPRGRGDDGGMESERRMARKKRQREKSVEDMETRSKSRRFWQSSESGEDMRKRSEVTAKRPHHQSTSPIAKKARVYSSGGSASECIDLTLELFGDSDSDCVVLSSPEQSPSDWDENETAGMSFESALGMDGRPPKSKLSLSSSRQTMASSQKGKSVAKTDTKEARKVTVEKTSGKKSFLSTRRGSSSDFEDEPISVRKIRSPASRVPPASRPTSSVPSISKIPPVVGGGSAKKHKTISRKQSSSMKLDSPKGKQSSLQTRSEETREQQSTSPVVSHKPSGTLINLSKVAAAEHAKKSSLHSTAARPSIKKKAPPAQPPSRPTFSIFKKKEVVLTGEMM